MPQTRILCLATFPEEVNAFLDKLVLENCIEPCRVPFGKVENRVDADTLPHHMTLTSGKIDHAETFLEALPSEIPEECFATLNDVVQNGCVLCLSFTPDEQLAAVQRKMYELLPENINCHPDWIDYHVTLDIAEDVGKEYTEYQQIRRVLSAHPELPAFPVSEIRMYYAWPPSPEPVRIIPVGKEAIRKRLQTNHS